MHGTNIKIAKEMLASEAEECCVVMYRLRGSRTPVVLVNFLSAPSTIGDTTSLGHKQKCRVVQNILPVIFNAATFFLFPSYCSCAV